MAKAYSIVASNYIDGAVDFIKTLAPGAAATLVREPNNEYDANAVAVWVDGRKVGFIPKAQNKILAAFIDQQGVAWVPPPGGSTLALDSGREVRACIEAKFIRSPHNSFPMVEV